MKVLQAMESSDRNPLEGNVEIKKVLISQETIVRDGSKKMIKKDVIIAIEKKSSGVARIYSRILSQQSKREFQKFVKTKILKDSNTKSCRWCSNNFENLENEYYMRSFSYAEKESMPLIKRMKTGIEAWLKGMHGKVQHLQFYLNEYCYRHNRHRMKGEIWDDLIVRMMNHKPSPYKNLIA